MTTEQQRTLVEAEIIDPMTAMFSPPYGSDEQRAATALRQYIEQLAEYPRDVLAAAWTGIVRGYGGRNWPALKTVIEHCDNARRASAAESPGKRTNWRKGLWPEVDRRTSEFVERFMAGPLGQRARDEGYDWDLRGWVRGVAHYQAQIVVRYERQGKAVAADIWNGTAGYPKTTFDAYLLDDMVREQDIAVSLPAEVVADLKARMATRAKLATEKTASAARGVSLGKAAKRALPAAPAPDVPEGGPNGPEPPPPESEYADEVVA